MASNRKRKANAVEDEQTEVGSEVETAQVDSEIAQVGPEIETPAEPLADPLTERHVYRDGMTTNAPVGKLDLSSEAAAAPLVATPARFRITTPYKRREFKSAGLTFRDGVAETTDPKTRDICRGLGYAVEEVEEVEEPAAGE